jgi:hypothetical protein
MKRIEIYSHWTKRHVLLTKREATVSMADVEGTINPKFLLYNYGKYRVK